MSHLRISIAGLMTAVVIIALDVAMFRSLLASQYYIRTSATTSVEFVCFALGVLPMASLLLLLVLVRLPKVLGRGDGFSFLFGFEVFGWAAVFVFIVLTALSPPGVAGYANAVGSILGSVLKPSIEHAPEWVLFILEFGLLTVVFGLPQLGIALLGGWLTRRAGFSICIERRERRGVVSDAV